jgi:urease accessory protein
MVNQLSVGSLPLLHLLQLVSPAMPIGTFAYSHGLEAAVELGLVTDAESTASWIDGLLSFSLQTWELPMLVRLHAGFASGDMHVVRRWNDRLFASRATAELVEEDRQLGLALARILTQLDLAEASSWRADPKVTYEAMFALACARWDIPIDVAARAYAFGVCEMLVGAATKLVPLGQSESQRILWQLSFAIAGAAEHAMSLLDEDMAAFVPGHAMVSAVHETQYSRLFRS